MTTFEGQLWYNLTEIIEYLNDKCVNQYLIYESIFHYCNFTELISSIIEILRSNNDARPLVIPIDLGQVTNDPDQVPYWVGLVIRATSSGHLEGLYSDSFGNPIFDELLSALNSKNIKCFDYSKKRNQNLSDCGVWTVLDLVSLATTGQLLDGIDQTMIESQRSYFQELKIRKKHGNVNNKVLEHVTSKEKCDKKNDILALEQMLKTILDFENNKIDLNTTLILIGELAGRVSYNDKGDKNSFYIRNKYGYIQRNKGKTINKDGIYFERLFTLSVIMKNENSFDCIFKDVFELIINDLSHLKQKLAYILSEENIPLHHLSNQIETDFTLPISSLTDFSAMANEFLIFRTIKFEIDNLQLIDFNEKDDRYYFARVFCIIGELLNELIEDKINDSNNRTMLKSFKNFSNIRHLICHFHRTILNGTINKNEAINEIILEIKDHFNEIICEETSVKGQLVINYQYRNAEKFEECSHNLLTYLTGKEKVNILQKPVEGKVNKEKRKKPKTVSIDDSKSIINKLIIKAATIIESMITNSSDGTVSQTIIDNKLKSINITYQLLLKNLKDDDKIHYPLALNIKNKQIIIEESKRINENPKICVINIAPISNEIDDKINKVTSKLETIQNEVTYLMSIINKVDLGQSDQRKSEYIFQHVMLVIGQLIRDIEDVNICNNKVNNVPHTQEYLQLASPYFHTFSKSFLLTECKIRCKKSRVKGLAHNVHSFDLNTFYEELKDVLNVSSHLDSFICVLKKENVPISALSFYKIGISFSIIGLHNESYQYLDKALQLIGDQPNEMNVFNDDSVEKNFMDVFGLPRLVYRIHRHMIISLFYSNQFERARSELQALFKRIDLKKFTKCENIELKNEVNSLFCEMSSHFLNNGEYNEARVLLEQAVNISEDFLVKLFLAKTYYYLKEYDKSRELCKIIFQSDPDIVGKFRTFELLIDICLDLADVQNGISEITVYISQMKELFQTEIRSFKSMFQEKYLLPKLIIIEAELNLLILEIHQCIEENKNVEINLQKLKEIDKEFSEMTHKLDEELLDNPQITEIYMLLCFLYGNASLILYHLNFLVPNETDSRVDINRECLDIARKNFDLAIKSIERFPDHNYWIKTSAEKTALILSRAYNKYVEDTADHVNIKLRLEYLMEALKLDEQYDLRKLDTINNLGIQYLRLANKYCNKYEENSNQEYSHFALINYNEAAKYFKWKIRELNGEDEAMESINESKIGLAYCFYGMGLLKYDIRLIRNTLLFFDELLRLSISEIDRKDLLIYRNIMKQLFVDLIEVLQEIQMTFSHDQCLSQVSEYAIDYCRIKLNIQICYENEQIKWIYKGNLSVEKLREQISLELNSFDELRLLHEFYKVLVEKNIILPKR